MKETLPLLTIVTPTYNRANLLPRLYKSLCAQTCKDFIWLVVDDGSTDNTKELVGSLNKKSRQEEMGLSDKTGNFEIQYVHKANGGKHTALNVAFETVETELLIVVDSDDLLTADAVETIGKDWAELKTKGFSKKVCGIGYLRGFDCHRVIGDKYSHDKFIDNFIDERYNHGTNGDKAEVWATGCLRPFRFPEYEGERFISESVAWIWLAERYNMLFVNKIIYITEYLEGGLSDNGRRLRFQCPHLMAYGSLVTMTNRFSLKIRIKETLLYIVYSLFGKFGWKRIISCEYKFLVAVCVLPGWLLYKMWKKKYNM